MEFVRASFGLLLLASGAATGIVLARRRRISVGRIVIDLLGIALGGIIGIAPGEYLILGSVVIGATGTRDGTAPFAWPDSLLVAVVAGGLGAGSSVGLAVAEKLNGQRRNVPALATSVGALIAGCLTAAFGRFLVQQGRLEVAALILIPSTVIGMTLAGCVLRLPAMTA